MAFAVDVSTCPQQFEVKLTQISAYKKSTSSDIAGWKEANAALKNDTNDKAWTFVSTNNTQGACFYKTATGETAKIFTFTGRDKETNEVYKANLLSLYFKAGDQKLNMLPELLTLSASGIEIYNARETTKHEIRAPLKVEDGRTLNFAVGEALIVAQ